MLPVLTLACIQDRPDAEWYLWIDSDTVIIDVAFTLPFQEYAGSDLVIWGNETRLMAGDGRHGEHSGCSRCGFRVLNARAAAWHVDRWGTWTKLAAAWLRVDC